MVTLAENSYGKGRVRLTKIVRDSTSPENHAVYEFTVEITLHGEFAEIYTRDDNSACVPTDTMKNTVYAVANTTDFSTPEHLAAAVADRLISRFDQINGVEVSVAAERWNRIVVDGQAHAHAFQKAHGQRTARVARGTAPRVGPRSRGDASDSIQITSGIRGMEVFKSTGSSFSGFATDEYTILKETDDRILATTILAEWGYLPGPYAAEPASDYDQIWQSCEAEIARTFSIHDSPSLQSTLYLMGKNVINAVAAVDWIRFVMPNQHHILFNTEPFGMTNSNEVFYGTDSPYGVISGTVARED